MIFEVNADDISSLSDGDLRTLIGCLAEQEVRKAGRSPSCVTYGGHQNASDGGIDVEVDLKGADIDGYIPRSLTGIQVKAEAMPASAIVGEMRPHGTLRPAIVQISEAGGAYIIASSKSSLAKKALSNRRNAMAKAVSDTIGNSEIHLDFYDQQRLVTWVNCHAALVPWVREKVGRPLSGWRPFGDWSSSPGEIDEPFICDEKIRIVGVRLKDKRGIDIASGISHLRGILERPQGAIRLVGLSGVGKTRFAQALFDGKIGSDPLDPRTAVYTDLGDEPDPVPLELIHRLHHLGQRCILIVDNCGLELHRKLVSRMKQAGGQVSLLTIEYDISDDEPEDTDVFRLEPVTSDIVEKIIKRRFPDLTTPEIHTIASLSEGNARIALALASTAKSGESLANIKDSELFERLFRQKNNEDSPELLRAAKVCSLVYSFDVETMDGDGAELPVLASLAGMSVRELYSQVAELRRRQLVQQRSKWRALLPHALAHKLAKEALEDIPRKLLLDHLTEHAPARLVKSFSKRLGYLHDSKAAQDIIADWLGDRGWLSEIENFNDLGLVIFDNIAPIEPRETLAAIQRASARDASFFESSRALRHTVIDILRSLAYEPSLFDSAIDLIRKFAHTAGESNNSAEAANVFKSLFYVGLSGTHATAKQRTDVLERLALSPDSRDHKLFSAGLDAMLECSYFTSGYSFEFGARPRDFGFWPRNRTEIQDWYRTVFELCSRLSAGNAKRPEVRRLLASQFRLLAAETRLIDELVGLGHAFAVDGGWPEAWAGVRIAAKKAKNAKRLDDAKKLESLAALLKPKSLSEQIATYVAPDQWSALDVAETELESADRYEQAQKRIEKICREIGGALANDLEALKNHLPQIMAAKGNRGAIVTEEVGRRTKNFAETWKIFETVGLDLASNGQVTGLIAYLLVGYREQDTEEVERKLDEVLADEQLHRFFLHMQCVVGDSDRAFNRLLRAAAISTIPTYSFGNLAWSRLRDTLSGIQLQNLLLALSTREGGFDISIDVLHMRLYSKREDKRSVRPEDIQTGRDLLTKTSFEKRRAGDDHELARIADTCLIGLNDESIARGICEALMRGIAEFNIYASDYTELVSVLAMRFPRAVLDVLVEKGQYGYDGRRGVFSAFRDRRPCPLSKIDPAALLEWANERPDTRFLQLADVIRPWERSGDQAVDADDSDETPPTSWSKSAMRILKEAPEPLRVLDIYIQRFQPSSWSGSLASILEGRLPLLEELARDADSEIAKAAGAAAAKLKIEIRNTREWEERHDRARDERFEW